MKIKIHTPETFWKRIKVLSNNECWPWQGANRAGYGTLKYQGKWWRSNRLAYFLTHNETPEYVCHTCDNPQCCNPKHLFAGNPKTNTEDMISKKRHAHGARVPNAVLNDETVLKLRKEYKENYVTIKSLSRKYNLSPTVIAHALNGKTWKHLPNKINIHGKRNHKLTPEVVVSIRKKWAIGKFKQVSLCREYNLHSATVCQVISGKLCRDIK